MIDFYRNAWAQACTDLTVILEQLTDDDIDRPTDCPGWRVRDVVAHLAHLEAVLAGLVTDQQLAASAPSNEVTSVYTESGVATRRDRRFADVVEEFTSAVRMRREQLADVTNESPAPVTPGGIDWSWDTLLRNRVIDVWVHDQDIRRAIDRPGNMDSAGAQVTATTFSHALPFVLAKRVGAGSGTSARWIVEGPVPFDFTVVVDADGRAEFTDELDSVDVTLRMTTEEFTILGAGRRGPDQLNVDVRGDTDLGRQILTKMAVTP